MAISSAYSQATKDFSTNEKEQVKSGAFINRALWGRISKQAPAGWLASAKAWKPVWSKSKYSGPGGWQFPTPDIGPRLRPKPYKGPTAGPMALGVKVGADFQESGMSGDSLDPTTATYGETYGLADPTELTKTDFTAVDPGSIFKKPAGLAGRRNRLGNPLV